MMKISWVGCGRCNTALSFYHKTGIRGKIIYRVRVEKKGKNINAKGRGCHCTPFIVCFYIDSIKYNMYAVLHTS